MRVVECVCETRRERKNAHVLFCFNMCMLVGMNCYVRFGHELTYTLSDVWVRVGLKIPLETVEVAYN